MKYDLFKAWFLNYQKEDGSTDSIRFDTKKEALEFIKNEKQRLEG